METGFHIDIYTLSDKRERELIERFLDEYTDRNNVEQTPDSELAILKDGTYNFLKSETLTNSITVGITDFTNCFTLYLNSKNSSIKSVILAFTEDGKLVLGLSIIEDEEAGSLVAANRLANELENNYFGKGKYFGVEECPPLNENDFFESIERYKENYG